MASGRFPKNGTAGSLFLLRLGFLCANMEGNACQMEGNDYLCNFE